MEEHLPWEQGGVGSSPTVPTMFSRSGLKDSHLFREQGIK